MIVSSVNNISLGSRDYVGSGWCGYLLNQAARRIRTMTAEALAPFGITPPQLRVLEAIAATEPISQARLGEMVNMDRSTIVHVIDRFEALGAASREADRVDRRSHAIVLTEKGRQLLADARDRALTAEGEFLAPLSHPERETLRVLLRDLFEPTPCPEEKDREPRPSSPDP